MPIVNACLFDMAASTKRLQVGAIVGIAALCEGDFVIALQPASAPTRTAPPAVTFENAQTQKLPALWIQLGEVPGAGPLSAHSKCYTFCNTYESTTRADTRELPRKRASVDLQSHNLLALQGRPRLAARRVKADALAWPARDRCRRVPLGVSSASSYVRAAWPIPSQRCSASPAACSLIRPTAETVAAAGRLAETRVH